MYNSEDTIGERIRKRRIELGMSQEELGRLVGYTDRSSITKIENGHNAMKRSKVMAFAEALNMDPIQLIGLSQDTQLKAFNYEMDMDEIPELKELNHIIKVNRYDKVFMARMLEYAKMLEAMRKGKK